MNIYNPILRQACRSGDKNIIDHSIIYGANDWKGGLANACFGGHKEIIDFMIIKGAVKSLGDEVNDWNLAFNYACEGGHLEIINFLIDKGVNNWTSGLTRACYGKHKEIVLLIILKGSVTKDFNINVCYMKLDFDDIYYLLQLGVTKFGKFNNIALECQKWKQELQIINKELFIKDIANIIVEY